MFRKFTFTLRRIKEKKLMFQKLPLVIIYVETFNCTSFEGSLVSRSCCSTGKTQLSRRKLQIQQQLYFVLTGFLKNWGNRKTVDIYAEFGEKNTEELTLLWPQRENNKQLLTVLANMNYKLTANSPFNICSLTSSSLSAPSPTFTALLSLAAVMLLQSACIKSPDRNKLARN